MGIDGDFLLGIDTAGPEGYLLILGIVAAIIVALFLAARTSSYELPCS